MLRTGRTHMGYALRRWLADHLPADLSSGERLIALEFADQASDQTRRAYGRNLMEAVVSRTGYTDDKQVRKVLTKLAARGIELREVLGARRDGRVHVAHEGHQTTYRIPEHFPGKRAPARDLSEYLPQPENPRGGSLLPREPPPGSSENPRAGTREPPPGGSFSSRSPQPSPQQQ